MADNLNMRVWVNHVRLSVLRVWRADTTAEVQFNASNPLPPQSTIYLCQRDQSAFNRPPVPHQEFGKGIANLNV